MIRNNLKLELLSWVLVLGGGIATFIVLPVHWLAAAPIAVFASYVVLETLLPRVWEVPPKGIRYEPGDDE